MDSYADAMAAILRETKKLLEGLESDEWQEGRAAAQLACLRTATSVYIHASGAQLVQQSLQNLAEVRQDNYLDEDYLDELEE